MGIEESWERHIPFVAAELGKYQLASVFTARRRTQTQNTLFDCTEFEADRANIAVEIGAQLNKFNIW